MNNSAAYWLLSLLAFGPGFTSAEIVTKRVGIEDIQHIHLLGPYQLTVTQGNNEYIELTTDSQFVDGVNVKLQGSKLVIGENHMQAGPGLPFKVTVNGNDNSHVDAAFALQVKELRSISNLGVGRIMVDGLRSDDLILSNLGTGQVTLQSVFVDELEINNLGTGRFIIRDLTADRIVEKSTGASAVDYSAVRAGEWKINATGDTRTKVIADSEAKELEISLRGAGEVDAESLHADSVKISIEGAGSARVHARDSLDVEIDGIGKVYYRGNPKVEKSIDSTSELIAIDQ